MKKPSDQFDLMKEEKSFYIDDYLWGQQKKCSKLLSRLNAMPYGDKRRNKIFQRLFAAYGTGNVIKEGFHCNYGFNITIGSDCFFNFGITILDSYEVEIGNRVFIAPQVVIAPVTHPLKASERKNLMGKKIVIEDDVWIGAGAVIFPGVTLHKGAIIGAGSVVRKSVSENTVVAGVPAKIIKRIDN